MKRGSWFAAVCVLASVTGFLVAGAEVFAEPLVDKSLTNQRVPPPSTINRSSDRARVYVDTSMSMKGYASAPSQVFRKFLERLKPVLVDAGIYQFQVVKVATDVGTVNDVAQFQNFGDPSLYNGRDTNLAAALSGAAAWNDGTVLVLTDGIVSLSHAARPASTSAGSCAVGSDAVCIATAAANYISKGNGFWIVGMRFPFAGPYYVEEPGAKSRRGQPLTKGPFPPHPFYVWVGSPSLNQGRQLVSSLIDFAKSQNLQTMAIEVSPGSWEGWSITPDLEASDLIGSENAACRNGDLLSGLQGGRVVVLVKQPAESRLNFGKSHESVLGFGLPVSKAAANPSVVHPLITVRQRIRAANPLVHVAYSVEDVKSHGTVRSFLDLCFQYEGDLRKSRAGTVLKLDSEWHADRSIDEPWMGWSSDTDDELRNLDRTVNLDTFLRLLAVELSGDVDSGTVAKTAFLTVEYQK